MSGRMLGWPVPGGTFAPCALMALRRGLCHARSLPLSACGVSTPWDNERGGSRGDPVEPKLPRKLDGAKV